jgi:O-antigen ligase
LDTKLKIRAILFALMLWLSLMSLYTPALVLVAVIAVLIDRAFLVPLMFTLPVIEGGYLAPFPVPTETFTLFFISPIVALDVIFTEKTRLNVDKRTVQFYMGNLAVAVFGTFTAIYNLEFGRGSAAEIIGRNVIIVLQINFFLFLYMNFCKMGIASIRRGLLMLQYMAAPFIFGIYVYLMVHGVYWGWEGYLNFGSTSHGTWTATLVGFSAYVFFNLMKKGSHWWNRILPAAVVGLTAWIVIATTSRNGIISVIIMFFLSLFLFRGLKFSFQRAAITLGVSVVLTFFVIDGWDKELIMGIRDSFNAKSLDDFSTGRTSLWKAGLQGFLERPLTGHGGHFLISRQYAERTVGIDNVIHNSFLETLFQYGVIGLFLYVYVQLTIFFGFFKIRKMISTKPMELDGVFLVPFLTYFTLLFSTLFVSWMWRTVVWYHTSLILAILTLNDIWLKNQRKEV